MNVHLRKISEYLLYVWTACRSTYLLLTDDMKLLIIFIDYIGALLYVYNNLLLFDRLNFSQYGLYINQRFI